MIQVQYSNDSSSLILLQNIIRVFLSIIHHEYLFKTDYPVFSSPCRRAEKWHSKNKF